MCLPFESTANFDQQTEGNQTHFLKQPMSASIQQADLPKHHHLAAKLNFVMRKQPKEQGNSSQSIGC